MPRSPTIGRQAAAVDDASVSDQDVEHGVSPWRPIGAFSSRARRADRRLGWPRSPSALSTAQSSINLRARSPSRVTESIAPFSCRTRTTSTASPSCPGATIASVITGSGTSAAVFLGRCDEDDVAAQELARRDACEEVEVPALQLRDRLVEVFVGQHPGRDRLPGVARFGADEGASFRLSGGVGGGRGGGRLAALMRARPRGAGSV